MYSFLLFSVLNANLAIPVSMPDADSEEGLAPATIRVHLPADARLYFDGEATQSTSSVREFTSPMLNPGKTYVYEIVGKVVRDGRTFTDRKMVDLRAGEVTEVTLNLPKPPNPPAPATLVLRLPADAQVTVDGDPVRAGGSVRQLESPPLEPGHTYTYTVVGQVVRDGRVVTASKEVDILADHVAEVTLDLPEAPVAYGLVDGGSTYIPQGTMGGRGVVGGFSGGVMGGGVMGGGFAGGGFSGGGMPYTSGGGGNSGPGAYALINGQKVFIPAGGRLPMGGMNGPHPGGFGHQMGGGHRRP